MDEIDERWYFLGIFISCLCYLFSYLLLHSGGYFLLDIGIQLIAMTIFFGLLYEYFMLRISYTHAHNKRKLLCVLTSASALVLIFIPIVLISIIPKVGLGPGSPDNPENIPIAPPHMHYTGRILLDMGIFGLLPFILGLIGFLVKKHKTDSDGGL